MKMMYINPARRFPAKLIILLILGCTFVVISNWSVQVPDNNGINTDHTLPSKELLLVRKIQEKATQILIDNNSLGLDIWMNQGKLDYDDDLLVEYVRETYMKRPDKSKPYSLTHPNVTNPSEGQVQSIWKYFENARGEDSFFVDCGAHDGEFISNTLWLEKEKGWNGLLIEADPTTFATLQSKHRKAWHANLCLSTDKFPKTVQFFQHPLASRGSGNGLNKRPSAGITVEIKVQCIPLFTMMLALKRNVIDFFSLDIEGLELEVLKTIPFDKILIKTFAIEHDHIPGGARILESFMKQKGYYLLKKIKAYYSKDSIFIHNSLRQQSEIVTTPNYIAHETNSN